MATACPDESKISGFVSRALQSSVVAQIEAHLADCGDCRDLVYALAGSEPATDVDRVGRFELVELIGHGAMGAVYRARDPELDRQVAVKVRRGNAKLDVAAEDRLRREAQALAKLAHPNVVAVYETGRHGDAAYVAMELVDGVTLDRWLAGPRTQRSVLDVMIGAGRGLAAAHEVGLIHRDFKPQNVIVGKADVPKVGDFGLVRVGQAETITAVEPASDLVVTLSVAGAIIGTPAYMAPEQLRGEVATEASDQFSFCVTLFEALYGARPFTGAAVAELLAAMQQGVHLPGTPRVPRHVRRVLARGLAYQPSERFASMPALLDALARRRSGAVYAAAGAGVAVAAAAAIGLFAVAGDSDACSGSERELAGIWDATRRAQITAAFRATGADGANEVATRTTALLDRHAKAWIAGHRDACQATRVRKNQPETVLALRNACLAERRGELRALADLMLRADAMMVGNAIDAAAALESVGQCADVAALQQIVRPPADPVKRALVEAHRVELASVTSIRNVARPDLALARARALVAQTERLDYAPLHADALALFGGLLHDVGEDEESASVLRRAAATADAAADDRARFEAYDALMQTLRFMQRPDQFEEALVQMRGIVERAPYDASLQHRLLSYEATALVVRKQPAEAAVKFRELITAIEKTGRADDPSLAMAWLQLGDALGRANRSDEARDALKRGEEVLARVYGKGGTGRIEMKSNEEQSKLFQAMVLIDSKRPGEALAIAEPALARLAQLHGPDHAAVGLASFTVGLAYYGAGNLERARIHHSRALAIHRGFQGGENIKTAACVAELARIDFDEQHFEQAARGYAEARDIYAKIGGERGRHAVSFDLMTARAQIAAGQLDAAALRIARVREHGGDLGRGPEAHVLEAELGLARGKPAKALLLLDKAFELPRGRGDWIGYAEQVRARALLRTGKKRDAIAAAERALGELTRLGKRQQAADVRALLDSMR